MNDIIPFHKPMHLSIRETEQIMNKIDSCLHSGMLTNNKNVKELEERIKDIHKTDYAIATSSCSQGLIIALQSLIHIIKQSEPYSKIFTSKAYTQSFTWYSTAYAIDTCNIESVFCDINLDTWNMIKNQSKYTLAVPVHTFGNVSTIESDFKVYDGAHCLGAKIKDIGDATVISLAPTKLITSIEGGIILTNDHNIAKCAIEIRDKISRMSEIHAIFGNAYLNHIDEVLKWKKEVYNYYRKHLNGIFQKTAEDSNHNTIGMLTNLKIPSHIETRKYYNPIVKNSDLPNTEEVFNNIICLPSWYGCPYKRIVNDINYQQRII